MIDGREAVAVAAFLVESERAFALIAEVFEKIAAGDYAPSSVEAGRIAKSTREFESQARQMRVLVLEGGTEIQ